MLDLAVCFRRREQFEGCCLVALVPSNPRSKYDQTKSCWKCGASFGCGPQGTNAKCWCDALPAVEPVADTAGCMCPTCLLSASKSAEPASERDRSSPGLTPRMSLVKDEDYYQDGPYIVFTAAYHRRRGYCCKNGCRHCPYPSDADAEMPK